MNYVIRPIRVGGFVEFEKSIFLMGVDPGTKIACPCVAWLIEGANGEKVLLDTGPHATEFPTARLHAGYGVLERADGERIDQALLAHGVDPAEIETVIFSHLHWDHCHNAAYLPNAEFYVQDKELKYAINPIPWHRGSFESGIPEFQPPWFDIFDRLKVVDGDVEILPGLIYVLLPGHTPGSAGISVQTAKGSYIIAGDMIPLMENWEGSSTRRHIPSSLVTNIFEYFESFGKIERLAEKVLPSHDARAFDFSTWGGH